MTMVSSVAPDDGCFANQTVWQPQPFLPSSWTTPPFVRSRHPDKLVSIPSGIVRLNGFTPQLMSCASRINAIEVCLCSSAGLETWGSRRPWVAHDELIDDSRMCQSEQAEFPRPDRVADAGRSALAESRPRRNDDPTIRLARTES
jgi:hypothetical protein